jgi:hydrogenase small subunit
MELTRREFLERGAYTVTLVGVTLCEHPLGSALCQADEPDPVAEIPLIWVATGACTGCSVSLLNAASPTVRYVLVGNVLPGRRLSLAFHSTLMAAGGDLAIQALERVAREHKQGYLLVVEGATATAENGRYCLVGETGGKPITGYEQVRGLARDAQAVLAIGACASFGGIPSAPPNPTGVLSVSELLEREGIETPLVNIPGCPPHPDWIVGTIATFLLGGAEALKLDEHKRPAPFFSECIHDNCPYRGHFDQGKFAEHFGEHGCLIKLGCKGPITHADCPIRKFNNGTSWCCQAGHPCIGCCHPDFPFEGSMFTPVEPGQLTFPGTYPSMARTERKRGDADTYAAVGMIGVGGVLAGVGVAEAARRLRPRGVEMEPDQATAADAKEQYDEPAHQT